MADISTSNFDAGSDSPSLARAQILDAVNRLNALTGTAPGGGSALVPHGAGTVGDALDDHTAALAGIDGNLNFTTLPDAALPAADTDLLLLRQGAVNKKMRIDVIRTELAAPAVAAQVAAEAARDATLVAAALYVDEPTGRAAVANGATFGVQGTGDVASYVYRRVDASSSTLVASYPALSALVAVQGAVVPLETRATDLEQASAFKPGALTAFRTIKRLELFGADAAKHYSAALYFRNDIGTRFNLTISRADDAAGTGVVDVASFSSSGVSYTGQQVFTLAQISGSGVTGTLVVDFAGAPATWAVYRGSGGATFANTAIRPDVLATSAAADAIDSARLAAAIQGVQGLSRPFAEGFDNPNLRALVRNVWVYGADLSHQYLLSQVEVQLFRRTIKLRDLTTGTDVAMWSVTATVTDYSTQPRWVKLAQGSLGSYSGVYAVLDLDWSAAVTGTGNYTLMTESGLHPDSLRSDETISDYLQRDVWHEVLRVGAGQTYTTLRAAVESLYDSPAVQTCARACYDHQILIDLMDAGAYNATFLRFPEFVGLRGQGADRTFIDKENDDPDAMLELHYETKVAQLTVRSITGDGGAWNGEYCLHSDDFNRLSKAGRNRRLRQLFRGVKLVGGPLQNAWLFGCGVSGGQHIRFDDCHASHLNPSTTLAAFGFHNTGITPSYLPSTVELIACRSHNTLGTGALVLSIGGGNKCRLVLQGGDLGLVAQGVTGGDQDLAADRFEWEITGHYDGPVVQADAGMIVLQTTAGQTPSGSAAALLFGTVDELGRGDKCITTGTIRSLGARLGDCTAVNKVLTIGGQTHTFNANHTAQTNAVLIAAINASLTTHPVSEKNIQYERYPDIGHTRRMLNSTGAAILAGRMVKRTGPNTIALASGDDDVFGVVVRDILHGLAGVVVTARKIHSAYITGATTDGRFGVSAGLLSFGAATKRGVVAGGIVTLY